MARVFVSYSHRDRAKVTVIAQLLETAGHQVWWDRRLLPGEDITKAIDHQLEKADAILALWSERSVASTWVRSEASAGLADNKLITVTIEKVAPPRPFDQIHTFDLSDWDGRCVKTAGQAVTQITHVLSQDPQAPTPAFHPPRPVRHYGGVLAVAFMLMASATAYKLEPFDTALKQEVSTYWTSLTAAPASYTPQLSTAEQVRNAKIDVSVDAITGAETGGVDRRFLREIISKLALSNEDSDLAIMTLLERNDVRAALTSLQTRYEETGAGLPLDERLTLLRTIGALAYEIDLPLARRTYLTVLDFDKDDLWAHLRLARLERFNYEIGLARNHVDHARSLNPDRLEEQLMIEMQDGIVMVYEYRYDEALDLFRDLTVKAREAGLDDIYSEAVFSVAWTHIARDEMDEAKAVLEDILPWQKQRGFDRDYSKGASVMGEVYEAEGNYEAARDMFEEFYAIQETLNGQNLDVSLFRLANVEVHLGDLESAEARFEQVRELSRRNDTPVGEFFAMLGTARIQSAHGDVEAACETIDWAASFSSTQDLHFSQHTQSIIEAVGCPFAPTGYVPG